MPFTHLHVHSEYSLLDGLSRIPDLVTRARELGMDSLAVTDHGALYGAIELYEEARKQGIKPLIGLEGYIAPGSRFARNPAERAQFHLTLLAQNATGYRNLMKLSSASHLEGFYYKPRMDRELLAAHSEGIIALSGCPSGELMSALGDGRQENAEAVAKWYAEVFPGRYYLEVQEHGQEQFSRLNRPVIDLGKRLDLPVVVTNDSHYTRPEQHHPHEVLLCIGTNSTMQDPNRFKLDGNTFYLRSEAEMRGLFPELPEVADNTARVAEQIDIQLDFGRTKLPDPGVPAGMTPLTYLQQLCAAGLVRRYVDVTEAHRERLRYELTVIEQTGFAEYMLIVRDIANFAHEQHIPMGVRGSAAASIVLYCLGVTDIEPTQYRLVFERFLNPERISMPDVDFDFADDRRDEVMRYAAERYGRDRVAQIVTFGTLGAKAAIRDTGRGLGMSYGDTDRVARLIPDALHITIEAALQQSEELKKEYETDSRVRELLDTARELEGVARHSSTHAAGVVITREPLVEVVPLQRATSTSANGSATEDVEALPTTQYAMGIIEKIGLLKLDFLGLTNLTILGRAVELIREERGDDLDLMTLPDGDPATAALLAEGQTFGVFQLESAGMRRYVQELQPEGIREVSAMVALYRPGPMEHIPRYIDVKHGRLAPAYPHPDLAGILDETYGVIVYQDQVLEIAKQFAGYSLGQADVMRKAMGKKSASVMLAEREGFVNGAVNQGYERRLAETLFDLIEPFAGYAFNKAHAFSYGVIAYQTAYLKAHYPVEYMTAVMMAAHGNQDRIAPATAEALRLGITPLPPDVNRSKANFSVEARGDDARAIRYGLAQIKNVGHGAVETLLTERESGGEFRTIEDFARRINPRDMNRRALESLAKAGALDSLADRGSVVAGLDRILALAQQEVRLRETGQTSMFDMFGTAQGTPRPALELPVMVTPKQELLGWERELLGAYMSDHPFKQASVDLAPYLTAQLAELGPDLVGSEAVVAGTVGTVRRLSTRQGKTFAAFAIEDLSGTVELTVWPDGYERFRELLVEGNVILARIGIRQRTDRLTLAVEDLCGYDLDTGVPVGFDPARFKVKARRRAAAPALMAGDESAPAGFDDGYESAPGHGHLRLVSSSGASADEHRPIAPQTPVEERAGPRRLRIEMDETTDEGADRRRIRKIVAVLATAPGDAPAELTIRARDGSTHRLRLGSVTLTEDVIRQLLGLLGVLGTAREIGDPTYSLDVAVAVGGG
ncbi:MAG: DNA polymerase III subunit alpha [Dehalococcoidia bacterium]|nr:DNA polymerase III subunit alpha [Dehalococcoidia bacterium]